MVERGKGSGGKGGGKWGKRGREVGVRGEGSGECLPPVHPLKTVSMPTSDRTQFFLLNFDKLSRFIMVFIAISNVPFLIRTVSRLIN